MGTTKKQKSVVPPPTPPVLAKRMVLQHVSGPLKGLFRIFALVQGNPPPALPAVCISGEEHIIQGASLISVYPRYALYREFLSNAKGKFGEEMPATPPKSFHPDQV